MIYFPTREYRATPAQWGMDYESVRLSVGAQDSIVGWFTPRASGAPYVATLLLCHGNGGNISHRLSLLWILSQAGFDVFVFDYRGYGQSTGRPGEARTYQDALRAWRYLREERGVPAEEIVLLGRSLGGPIAAYVASQRPVGALALDSTFPSLIDMARHYYPFLPMRWLLRVRYETLRYARRADCRILVAHGREDRVVPFDLGVALFEGLPEPKAFRELRGGHNDTHVVMGEAYGTLLRQFVEGGLACSKRVGDRER